MVPLRFLDVGDVHDDWLFGWLELNGLTGPDKVSNAMRDRARFDELLERAHNHRPPAPPSTGTVAIVAGRSLDLTSYLACGHPDCLSKQIDALFANVWHYFDEIFVVGPDAHWFEDKVNQGSDLTEWVIGMSGVYGHIKDLGVESLLRFSPKPPSCNIHWPELATFDQLHLSIPHRDDLVSTLARESRLVPVRREGEMWFQLHHPALIYGQESYKASDLKKTPLQRASLVEKAAWRTVERYWLAAAADMFAAEEARLPVGVGVEFEARVMHKLRPLVTEEDVAFHLQLPVVRGLPVAELLALRGQESDAFEAFRLALRRAAGERIKSSNSLDAPAIAREIADDLIAPSLNDIRRRLSTAQQLLDKKHHLHLAVTGLATVCGILGAGPVALGLAGVASSSALNAKFKAMEEGREVALDDMYFLWRVEEHQDRSRHRRASKKVRSSKKRRRR